MIVIGEKVNATRKAVREALTARDGTALRALVRAQDEAGADLVDLNVGTGVGSPAREVDDMRWLIDLALETTDKELCIDSADPAVLRAAAKHLEGRRGWMLNSIKGEEGALAELLPLAAEHDVPFIALAMDENGVAPEAGARLAVCAAVDAAARDHGIPPGRVFFDPLVLPLVTDPRQAQVTLACLEGIRRAFPEAKTAAGLTNVSFGLPRRALVNRAFLVQALSRGLDAALLDPTDRGLMQALLAGRLLAGLDPRCRRWTRAARQGLLD